MSLRRFALCLSLLAAAPAAAVADVRIIGDSIGEGVHMVTNLPSPANRFNVAIYTPLFSTNPAKCRAARTVVMSLGTNDAVGGASTFTSASRRSSRRREAQGVKLVWLGPPCVLKPWETYSKKLDEILAAQLEGGSVTYVSLQGPEFCERSLHAGDGVHFTMAGYGLHVAESGLGRGSPGCRRRCERTQGCLPQKEDCRLREKQ